MREFDLNIERVLENRTVAHLTGTPEPQNFERGTQHDETQWLDVGVHACRQLSALEFEEKLTQELGAVVSRQLAAAG
jgi:hypothetical protein